jgi:hypothetical protein
MPTDDVLIVRKVKGKGKDGDGQKPAPLEASVAHGWPTAQTLPVAVKRGRPDQPSALVLGSLDDVRWVARRAPELAGAVRAVIAPHIPAGVVALLAGAGILALRADPEGVKTLQGSPAVALPAPGEWNGDGRIQASAGAKAVELTVLAVGVERAWTAAGSARSEIPLGAAPKR